MSSQTTGAREGIAAANDKFMSAFERGDARGVAALYTDDILMLPPGRDFITGKEGVEAFWAAVMEMGVRRAGLHTLEVDEQGDTAIEIGRGTLYAANGEVVDEPKYLVVWKRDGDQWKLHRDIWNSDKAG